MAGTSISAGNLKTSLSGTEKIPVNGASTPVISVDQVKAYSLMDSAVAAGNPIAATGKIITFFGDSITTGVPGPTVQNRWTSLLCAFLGATENNLGIGATTLQKQAPINWSGASPNMVDNIAAIPTKTAAHALLVFPFGLNDIGYNGGGYNTANFITDYTTVINACVAKGWPVKQILLIAPFYINATGYATYTALNGTVPDATRHLAFIAATKTVALTFGTLFIDIYSKQLVNDTTLLIADGVHPTNAGHAYIANEVASYLFGQQILPYTHTDSSTFANAAYFHNVNDYAILSVNQSPTSSIFKNTAKGVAQVRAYSSAAGGRVEFLTTNAVNTTIASVTAQITELAEFRIPTIARTAIYFGTAGSLTSTSTTTTFISGGMYFNGVDWKNLGVNASMLALSQNGAGNAGFSFYVNAAIGGAGTTFTPTEIVRVSTTGWYFGGGVNATAKIHIAAGSATANTAPLQFTSGSVETVKRAGLVEYNGRFIVTESDTVNRYLMQAVAETKTTAGAPYTNDGFVTAVINGVSVKLMTTA